MKKSKRIISILNPKDLKNFNEQKKQWPLSKKIKMAILCEFAHTYWTIDDYASDILPDIKYELVEEQKRYLKEIYGEDEKNHPRYCKKWFME